MLGLSLSTTSSQRRGPIVIDFTQGAPLTSFTRASNATAENLAGLVITTFGPNTPRMTDRGLLLERSARNVQVESDEASLWNGEGHVVTENAAIAPNGYMDADRVQLQGPGVAYIYRVSDPLSNGVPVTCSFWAKARTAPHRIGLRSGQSGVNSTRNITTSWQRFTWTIMSTSTTEVFQLANNSLVGGGVAAVVDIDVWGFQVEEGEVATSYIHTDTGAVTRAADEAYLDFPVSTYSRVTFTWEGGEESLTMSENNNATGVDLTGVGQSWIGSYLQRITIER